MKAKKLEYIQLERGIFDRMNAQIDELMVKLAEAKAGWDSSIAASRKSAKICAEIEAKMAACEWKPITETDLPKVGDEVLRPPDHVTEVFEGIAAREPRYWKRMNYSHFRPINPPQQGKP